MKDSGFFKRGYLFLFSGGIGFFLGILHLLHRHYYFRDYGIIWEGAYRLWLGQTPYVDFGLPTGIGSFLIPLLTFCIFGPDYDSLLIASVLLDWISIYAIYRIYSSLGIQKWIQMIGISVFAFYYLSQIKYPWYNSTALAFELLGIAFICWDNAGHSKERRFQGFFSAIGGFFVFLTILTKQDFGGLALIISVLIILSYTSTNKSIKSLLGYFSGLGLSGLVYFLIIRNTEFFYWFNYGQYPHENRLKGIPWGELSFVNPYYLITLLILCVVAGLFYQGWIQKQIHREGHRQLSNFWPHFVFVTGLIAQSWLTYWTSGLNFLTGGYAVAPAIVFIITVGRAISRTAGIAAMSILSIFFLLPKSLGVRDLENWYAGSVADVSGSQLSEPCQNGIQAGYAAFGHEYLLNLTWEGLKKAELYLPSGNYSCQILNMTELTPLALQWKFTPCTGMPLWYHSHNSLFPREIQKIQEGIRNKSYGMVLLQWTHEFEEPTYSKFRELLMNNYVFRIKIPAPRSDAPIFVYTAE
ncbi:MAG TPA: hypothetical protein VNJ07_07580 [Chitinophagales bacterium]|nr:hypothetical protein [Chitinophagales bacterium]